MLITKKRQQMSFDTHPSSEIIFLDEENNKSTNQQTQPSLVVQPSAKQHLVVKQIATNLIKIKSNPRLKNRAKVTISQLHHQPEVVENMSQKVSDFVQLNSDYGKQIEGKSETSSNKQTKPTKKTLDEQEFQEDMIEQIFIRQEPPSKYEKPVPSRKQQFLHPQALHPRKAKRQLGSSDDEYNQKQEQSEEESAEDSQDDSEEIQPQKQVVTKNYGTKILRKNEILTMPSIQLSFSRQKLRKFVQIPIKPGYQMKCMIEVENGFLGFASKYHLKQKYQTKTLISAKKQVMSFTPSIILSFSRVNHSRRNQDFFGILQSNFSGTSWTLNRPEIGSSQNDQKSVLAAYFAPSILGSKSMREMRAELIDPAAPKEKKKLDLENMSKSDKKKYVVQLAAAKPKFEKGKYQLDFKGVAKMASSKNLILCNKDGEECLILGKHGQKTYQMNVQYPLSLAQGFSLCLASLEGKLMVN